MPEESILAEQLASAAFRGELVSYLEQRRQICSETRRYFSDSHDEDLVALCDYWSGLYEGLEREFEEMNGDLLGQFRALRCRPQSVVRYAALENTLLNASPITAHTGSEQAPASNLRFCTHPEKFV